MSNHNATLALTLLLAASTSAFAQAVQEDCPPEALCTDGIDNDADGLTDCDDSDCDGACSTPVERLEAEFETWERKAGRTVTPSSSTSTISDSADPHSGDAFAQVWLAATTEAHLIVGDTYNPILFGGKVKARVPLNQTRTLGFGLELGAGSWTAVNEDIGPLWAILGGAEIWYFRDWWGIQGGARGELFMSEYAGDSAYMLSRAFGGFAFGGDSFRVTMGLSLPGGADHEAFAGATGDAGLMVLLN